MKKIIVVLVMIFSFNSYAVSDTTIVEEPIQVEQVEEQKEEKPKIALKILSLGLAVLLIATLVDL